MQEAIKKLTAMIISTASATQALELARAILHLQNAIAQDISNQVEQQKLDNRPGQSGSPPTSRQPSME